MTYPDLPAPGYQPDAWLTPNRWSVAVPATQREHWVKLAHRPLEQIHLNTYLASDPWTGKTQSMPLEYLMIPPATPGSPGNIRDVYIGYQGMGYRYFEADWNGILGPTYGGWPKQDRFYEFLTDPSEPFPSYYPPAGWYNWWYLSFDPGSTGGYGGSSNPMPSWNAVGNWRRYSDGGEDWLSTYFWLPDTEWYHRMKWISAGMTWCDTTGWGGLFDFGQNRKTHAGYTVGTRVHRLGEETDPVAYEGLILPEQLNPDYLDYLPRGYVDLSPDPSWLQWLSVGMNGFRNDPPDPEWQTPLYNVGTSLSYDNLQYRRQSERYVRYPSDQTAVILGWRMVLRLRNGGTYKHQTPGVDAGQIDRYEIYTNTSPTYIYPWDPGWTGTKVTDLFVTWGNSSAGNFHSHGGSNGSTFTAYSNPTVSITGATVTPFTDPLADTVTTGDQDKWKSFYVTGFSPYDFGSGDYSDIHVVPWGYFHEPPCSAGLTDGPAGSGNFYVSANLQMSIEWEALVRLPTEFKLIWIGQHADDQSVLRYLGRDDAYGYVSPGARMSLYSGSEKTTTRLPNSPGTYR